MSLEITPGIISAKERRAARLFCSRRDREKIIGIYERRCAEIPERADAALVLGTSPILYPGKFKKRVYTAVWLANRSIVPLVIFSGNHDHETCDTDQACRARDLAITEFGLDKEKIMTVGGNNTAENLQEASKLLAGSGNNVKDLYIVSDGLHLIRVLPLADHVFGEIGVQVHPFPIINEGKVDPNDPKVIEEIIKAVLYNRTLNKNVCPVSGEIRSYIDGIASYYTEKTRAMSQLPEVSFDEWRVNLH
ncbi:hypothetical protein A2Z67_01980 [Candidatus Woesebacteria bacterium RBG_13_36_22]|uniref:DUF218 domain-containing protein n=1 Tax=Candidatus Woesebacteria bacterium RBG_13_36_22 TaxID=1802478 RepID=A0A1F7X6V5_9BACT|nr:MAG: hypothetical protein A2Z67_01980 [Candidatus Woesebacteria bacterium RBG_13_36_22]